MPGLVAVLQKLSNQWHSVAYASWSMINTESQYAQIEKKALTACEKFACYIQRQNCLSENRSRAIKVTSILMINQWTNCTFVYDLWGLIFVMLGKQMLSQEAILNSPLKLHKITLIDQEQAQYIKFHVFVPWYQFTCWIADGGKATCEQVHG